MSDIMSGDHEIPIKPFSARFKLIQELGSGSFGTVSLYKMSNDVMKYQIKEMEEYPGTLLNPLSIYYKYNSGLIAIKTMNKKLKRRSDYSRIKEIQFIFSVNSHFNLVQIIDVFIDRSFMKLNIVMENMDQNLYQLMKARNGTVFSPRTLKSVLSQLLSAISHIHKHMFFHRDVKPENILVMQNLNYFGSRSNIPLSQRENSYIIKLADYGLARHETNQKQFTAYVSTRWYRSPEILFRNQYYSYPIDIWAFGCVAVECATFYPLFPGKNELDQCCKIMEFLGNPNKNFQLMALQSMHKPDLNSETYNDFQYKPGYNYQQNSMIPFGGFWNDANTLGAKLGIIFPKHFGYRLESLIKRTDFTPMETLNFFQMIKSCLTWDPTKRATAQDLIKCPYFDGFGTDLQGDKENVAFATTATTPCGITSVNDHLKKSMIFAGLSPTKPLVVKVPNTNDNVYTKPVLTKKVETNNINNSIKPNDTKMLSNNKVYTITNNDSYTEISNAIDREIAKEQHNVDIPVNSRSPQNCPQNLIKEYNLNYLTLESEDLIDKNEIYQNIGLSQVIAADDDDDEDDDVEEDDELEESEEDLIPLEYNVSTILQEGDPLTKLGNADISIKSRNEGNFDLIDAINFELNNEIK
ncbi:hypothetical protein CANINC_004704 [Pichia inconspicua]|uniref:Protein kinase domain-containing protein n=1 Tax=Pichia inconspicua TaxID=52247 RepID=A0A4T0WW05_9ASCO|nr:hypothetical protein CANINC_004704 [[Candida] inconspicua]